LRYVPIFEFAVATAGPGAFSVVADTYVTDDSGTGIVHQAPAFGEDDFRVCLASGVLQTGQQPFDPTDANGRFTDAAPDFKGKGVKEADKDITAAIKARHADADVCGCVCFAMRCLDAGADERVRVCRLRGGCSTTRASCIGARTPGKLRR
jgi:hypothetical protein